MYIGRKLNTVKFILILFSILFYCYSILVYSSAGWIQSDSKTYSDFWFLSNESSIYIYIFIWFENGIINLWKMIYEWLFRDFSVFVYAIIE